MDRPGLRGLVSAGATVVAATVIAGPALASAYPPAPGVIVNDENGKCTAGFAAQDGNGNYYLLTSGHCDAHDGSEWTYGPNVPLGRITASENEGDKMDAAIILVDPSVGAPAGDVGGTYPVRDVLGASQIRVGMPFCKLGATTGETCGAIKSIDADGDVIAASVYSLIGDSGSPGFVKNADGTVSAVAILMSSPRGDDYTTYFVLVQPILDKWGLHILR